MKPTHELHKDARDLAVLAAQLDHDDAGPVYGAAAMVVGALAEVCERLDKLLELAKSVE